MKLYSIVLYLNGIQNAANYLRSAYGSLKRPYSLAISAYLSLVDEAPSLFLKTLLLKAASPGREMSVSVSLSLTPSILCCASLLFSPPLPSPPSFLPLSPPPDGTHWPDSENRLFTLEATGYALLALVKSSHMTEAATLFEWLNEQRRRGGGYGSTQVLSDITGNKYCMMSVS